MKSILRILFCCLAFTCYGQTRTTVVTLEWDYEPAEQVATTTFQVYSATNLDQPKPWPMISSVPGALSLTVPVTLEAGQTRFFYVTATQTSTETEAVLESDPSDVVSVKFPKAGHLKIKLGAP